MWGSGLSRAREMGSNCQEERDAVGTGYHVERAKSYAICPLHHVQLPASGESPPPARQSQARPVLNAPLGTITMLLTLTHGHHPATENTKPVTASRKSEIPLPVFSEECKHPHFKISHVCTEKNKTHFFLPKALPSLAEIVVLINFLHCLHQSSFA